ncbi:hypothetical protein HORM4_830026 [Vibrio harveyi]|nr:hypothetical protein HORM4_830026 [Vibrio harveyi]
MFYFFNSIKHSAYSITTASGNTKNLTDKSQTRPNTQTTLSCCYN